MSTPLNKLCELIVDCPHSTAPDEGEGYPLIRTPNIGPGYLDLTDVHRVSKEAYDIRNARAVPQPMDLILVREAPAGNVGIIREEQWVCLGQRTVLIRPDQKKVDPWFLNYYLNAPRQRHRLLSNANGATVSHVNMPIIRNLPVDMPSMEAQRHIASILMAYDNLIENNRRQIALLEEAAQRLYKEWFVDQRFPGHEDIEIVDGIPDGWQIVQIRDVCKKIQSGGTPSRKKASFWDPGTVKWFKTGELQDCWLIEPEELISDDGLAGSAAKLFPPLTIVMAIYASPTLGRLGVLNCEAAFNQAMLGFIVNEDVTTRDWLYWKLFELRTEFNLIARGAGQQNISGEIVKSYEVLLPPRVLAQKFSDLVGPMAERRLKLQEQNLTVSEARDRLLPKLMSGEIEV